MNALVRIGRDLRIFVILIVGMLFVPLLAGCASDAEFPIGRFDCVECEDTEIEYSDNGTLVVYRHGEKWFTGKWSVNGDIFYTGDNYCFDINTTPASYKWDFDGEILTLQVIKDDCSDRVDSLDGKPWRFIGEK